MLRLKACAPKHPTQGAHGETMVSDIRTDLRIKRDSLTRQLAELAVSERASTNLDRIKSQTNHLLDQIAQANAAIEGTYLHAVQQSEHAETTQKYTHLGRPIEAITYLLDEYGMPMTREEIIQRLCDGGYRGGASFARLLIVRGLDNFLTGTGSKGKNKDMIRQVGDLIGRGTWDDERFKQ